MRSVEAPVSTHGDLQRRYDCSRMWEQRQIQKNHFPKPETFGSGVDLRPRAPLLTGGNRDDAR
jgi:hypothetical protein